jgi:phenylalanyl-tRNA synthetase beta chain
MNISLNWLSDYVEIDLPAEQLGELFTRIGLNCEGIAPAGDDIVFDLEVTSNRPDWLGHLGVARELAAATGKAFTPPAIALPAGEGKVDELTAVTVEAPDLCPRYTARVIRDVTVGPSPAWLKEYLQAVGMRSINNVVDVTNFILMEYSQPLHSFDYDKLTGHRIVVRRARKGESLLSIDETRCELTEEMLVIADADKPVAIAGVMGGLDSEVSDVTTTVLLESARFAPLSIRQTSRALGLMSESNYRFERGVDPVAVETASARAAQLLCELAGGTLVEGMIDVWAQPFAPAEVALRPARVKTLLGIDVPVEQQVDILDRLGLAPREDGEQIVCTAPPWRADLTREVDLIEEVARLVGYETIPTLHEVSHPVRPMGRTERVRRQVLSTMAAAGYSEAITFSFCDAEQAKLFCPAEPITVDSSVRRSNNALRPTLLISLLDAVKNNQDLGNADVSLFELAAVFPPGDGPLPNESIQLAAVTTEGLRDVRGAIEALIERINPAIELTVVPDQPGQAQLLLDKTPAGRLEMIDPTILDRWDIEKPIAAATVDFQALLDSAEPVRTAQPLPRFPAIRRDLSLVVDEAVTWAQLRQAVDSVDQPLRSDVAYVTTYRGKQIPAGSKSVTLSAEYRSEEGTLTHAQADEQVEQLTSALADALGAELRS